MNTVKYLIDPNLTTSGGLIHNPERVARIAELAYLKSEQRGFVPGHEMDDWLMAEREVLLSECSHCYSKEIYKAPPKAA